MKKDREDLQDMLSKTKQCCQSIWLSQSRERDLVDIMHNLGLCISYDRLRLLSTDLANQVALMYEK